MLSKGRFPNVMFGASLQPQSVALAIMLTLFTLIFLFMFITVAAQPVQSQTYRVIHDFAWQDGIDPLAGLTSDIAGNLYGTTYVGGSGGGGSVFRLRYSNGTWVLTPLYSFRGGIEGTGPYGGVILDRNGSLYGTTGYGGHLGYGTVFSLRPSAHAPRSILDLWTEVQLYEFMGGSDGANPYSGNLVLDQSGNIYGTMMNGGSYGRGYVYQLTPSGGTWTKSILYSFTGGSDGGDPVSGVMIDSNSNLFGTTTEGGDGHGVVFELTRSESGWTLNVIYRFHGGSDGSAPYGGLIFDAAGNLYGTTCCGGLGGGTVFMLMPNNGQWTFVLLYSFATGQPMATLAMDVAGNLYGTTSRGGAYEQGTVFELSRSGGEWTYGDLHDFSSMNDGYYPNGVAFDKNGNLFGTTCCGGINAGGVIFEITQ